MVFNNGHNDYTKHNYYFQKDKKPININAVDIKKIVLSNEIPYCKHDTSKYYIAYLSGGLRPLHSITKDIKLYTNHMNPLTNDNELLKYIEIQNKIEALFNKKFNKRGLYSNFHGNKRLIRDEYYGHSFSLLLESISEVNNKYYPQTFLHKVFECNSVECSPSKKNSLFKELVQIVDWSDESNDRSNDKSNDKSINKSNDKSNDKSNI